MIIKIIVSKFLTHTLTIKNLQTQNQLFTLQRNINEVIEDFTISFNSIRTQKRYKTVLKQFFEPLEVQKLEQLAIKKAYRKLAKLYHPDLALVNKEKAEEIFKMINRAYENLG